MVQQPYSNAPNDGIDVSSPVSGLHSHAEGGRIIVLLLSRLFHFDLGLRTRQKHLVGSDCFSEQSSPAKESRGRRFEEPFSGYLIEKSSAKIS